MKHIRNFLLLVLIPLSLYAKDANSESEEVMRLRNLIIEKDEQIKVLLMALKNGEEEKHASLSSQKLNFKKVQLVTPTKVILKPEGLSEESISEIDKESQIYKELLPVKEEVAVVQAKPVARRLFQPEIAVAVETEVETEPESEPEPEVEPEPIEEVVAPVVTVAQVKQISRVVAKRKSELEEPRVSHENEDTSKLVYMQPSKFKVIMLAPVYQNFNAEMTEEWEVDKTFTSNRRRGKWIMITGIITDKKGWVKSPTTLWIQESFVKKVR